MGFLTPLLTALGFFSIIPMPQTKLFGEKAKGAILFLPAVGVIIGISEYFLRIVCLSVSAEPALFGAVSAVLPLIITGGLHMDGFMDCADAICSRQSRERKLEIMKDPHSGAFAVIWCAAYLILSFGLWVSLYNSVGLGVVCVGFTLSRTLSVHSVLTMPKARKGGLLRAFAENSKRGATFTMLVTAALCIGAMLYFSLSAGFGAIFFSGLAYFAYRRIVLRQFGGITGDTCGFFIQLCELFILIGVVIGGFL